MVGSSHRLSSSLYLESRVRRASTDIVIAYLLSYYERGVGVVSPVVILCVDGGFTVYTTRLICTEGNEYG
jgi:hypothetical protein